MKGGGRCPEPIDRQESPVSGASYYLFLAGSAVLGVLPYLIDRVVVPLQSGLLSTLVVPLATTSVAYLGGCSVLTGPSAIRPPQYGNLPLLRLLSVTGLWGIVFARAYAPLNDDLLAHSEQEARAGAKIIVWPEGGAQVLQEDEAALLGRASTLARPTGVRTRHLPYVRL